MLQRNQDIRDQMKQSKIPYWRVAECLGVHENTVYRMLNKELDEEQRNQILAIVNGIKEANAVGA